MIDARHYYFAPPSSKELISRGLKKRIFRFVIAGHLLFIAFPFLVYITVNWLMPKKPRIIKVTLVPPAPALPSSPPVSLPAPPEPTPRIPEPEPVKPRPKKRPVEKKIRKPKPKPQTKPKPKPVVKKTYLKPSDIKVSNKIIEKSEPVQVPSFSANKFASKLKNLQPTISAHSSTLNHAGYFATVGTYLRPKWKQPVSAFVGNARPSVTVHVSVNSSGRILSWRIVRSSGIPAMDSSVRNLFNDVHSLPKPPSGAVEFDITLELD